MGSTDHGPSLLCPIIYSVRCGSLPGKPCPALFQSFDSFSIHIDAVVCSLKRVDHETADCGISIHTLTRFTSSQSCLLEIAVASYLSESVVAFPDLKHELPLPGAFKWLTKRCWHLIVFCQSCADLAVVKVKRAAQIAASAAGSSAFSRLPLRPSAPHTSTPAMKIMKQPIFQWKDGMFILDCKKR
jgi:hypothetical protein